MWEAVPTNHLAPLEFRKKFLNDPAFRSRFEKKEVEVTLDEKWEKRVPNSSWEDQDHVTLTSSWDQN